MPSSSGTQIDWKRRAGFLEYVGRCVVGIGYIWLIGILFLVWQIFPSEAPLALSGLIGTYMPGKETFSKQEVGTLFMAMIDEQRRCYPNPIYPLALILGGSLLIGISRGLAEKPNAK